MVPYFFCPIFKASVNLIKFAISYVTKIYYSESIFVIQSANGKNCSKRSPAVTNIEY
jgi:hypothetical protein